jgi:hypothetical protein
MVSNNAKIVFIIVFSPLTVCSHEGSNGENGKCQSVVIFL